ncbi:iron-sulfur protein [Mycolicibacterium madagascariense]|uniref:Iron-sulfur protein n=1 Tax=Mycolicibacterium madagascariense TaxID=212765 RepID=A0A7I7XAA7_9MYCO|nr:iron-sulfur protein [Mycolicibacterium madagascariense]
MRVISTRYQSEGVTSYELGAVDSTDLPDWSAGAHLDLHLPSGITRQYSLCGDPANTNRYRIAVLEIPSGRGGSVEAHRELRPGVVVETGRPRNAFTLVDAERYLFLAGGIGITPLLPMIHAVEREGREWDLVYCARSARHFSFVDEVQALNADRVRFIAEDVDGRPDLGAVMTASGGAAVFCCGPAGLMDALTAKMSTAGRLDELHLERFTATSIPPVHDEGSATFLVELSRSGLEVEVTPNVPVLEAIRAAGVAAPSSCEMGMCGTCETKVLAGRVDHRDDLLTAEERRQNTSMMICVSRAASPRLVLDL